MKNVWKPFLLIVIIGILVVVIIQASPNQERLAQDVSLSFRPPIGTSVGELAPELTGTTLDGERITLSELRGTTVLLNIFASWCGPCRAEAPHLAEVDRITGEEVVFIGLNMQENPQAVQEFKDEFGLEFPLILNHDGKLTQVYQPVGLPTSWFIDPQGIIRYVHAGPMTTDLLLAALEDARAGREHNPFTAAP